MAIPHGDICGSQQIGRIDLSKFSSQTSLSSSSDSSTASSSDFFFVNMKIRNALTITLNMNVDCTSNNF